MITFIKTRSKTPAKRNLAFSPKNNYAVQAPKVPKNSGSLRLGAAADLSKIDLQAQATYTSLDGVCAWANLGMVTMSTPST